MSEEMGPLPDALARLFAAERRASVADGAEQARVWAAIATKLPGGGGGGGGGGAGGAGAGKGAGAIAKTAALGGLGAVAIAIAVVTATRGPATPPPHVATPEPAAVQPAPNVERTLPPEPPPVAAPAKPSQLAPRPAPPTVSAPPPAPPAAAAPVPTAEAEAEDVAIERAKIALVRAEFTQALALLSEHERRFPTSPLRAQRELLIVRALLGTSNRPAAVERAARLRRADPNDPALPAIDAALAKQGSP